MYFCARTCRKSRTSPFGQRPNFVPPRLTSICSRLAKRDLFAILLALSALCHRDSDADRFQACLPKPGTRF